MPKAGAIFSYCDMVLLRSVLGSVSTRALMLEVAMQRGWHCQEDAFGLVWV